ncbi:50S ribosomal protein L19 [bacterium]|nr:50S ribosomal protein L19 [bacterium]
MSSSQIIEQIENAQIKENTPQFSVGDTVVVSTAIIEGKKRRIQKFEGTVVKKTGKRVRESFTVRRVIDKIGVEKTFLLHSPLVEDVSIVKRGVARRARLNYLRGRVGAKANRMKTKETKVKTS